MGAESMLAIWSDVAPESETDYLHWLTREHTIERVSTAGFLGVRVFRAMEPDLRRFFIVYELDGLSVLDGEDYVRKLNNPTPWSQRIMPTLKNFVRGGGLVIAKSGIGQGGFAAAIPLDDAQKSEAQLLVPRLVTMDRISSARLIQVDTAKTSIPTREKSMRREDKSFANLLVFDGLDAVAVRSALDAVQSLTRASAIPQLVYKQVFQLDRRQLAGV